MVIDDVVQRCRTVRKYVFQKVKILLKDSEVSLETKKSLLDCYTIDNLYGSKCWKISPKMMKGLEVRHIWKIGTRKLQLAIKKELKFWNTN